MARKEGSMKIHIVGIGGAGMSAIAIVLKEMGYEVSGSDLKRSRFVDFVESRGIEVKIGHDGRNVLGKDLVIYSTAIRPDNPEIRAAREMSIPVIHRSDSLKFIAERKKLIAVTGSHGKTTTTSLLAHVLRKAGMDVGFIVGGEVNDYGSNAVYGSNSLFVLEADESDGTFLKLNPYCSVFTNLEPEHMDFYGSEERLKEAATSFIQQTENYAVVFYDDKRLKKIVDRLKDKKVVSYGFKGGDFRIISFKEEGESSRLKIVTPNQKVYEFEMKLKGRHNACNATAVCALALTLGVEEEAIREGLKTFSGVGRRLQLIVQKGGISVYDDYAHHPTEIATVLESLKKMGFKRVIAVFQPHRYTRTMHLMNDFPFAFASADAVVLTEIYNAGEEPIPGVTGKYLFELVAQANPNKLLAFIPRLIDLPFYVVHLARRGDAVVFLGAGDITIAARETARLIEEKSDNT